jgi:hypothetical protein
MKNFYKKFFSLTQEVQIFYGSEKESQEASKAQGSKEACKA